MKKILYILAMAVATMFTSCQKDADVVDLSPLDRAVEFSSESIVPLTRVSGTSWDENDAIGITMLSSSDNSTIIYDNIKYTAETEGTSVSFNTATEETILYPEDGSAVDFAAYYPYQEGWSYENGSMLFDLSGQDGTADAQSKVDILESAITNQTYGKQNLTFTHSLSKVQITVSNHEMMSAFENLDNLTATLYTKRVQYNLLTKDITKSDENKELQMVKTTDGDKAIFTAIFAPGEVSDEIIFTDGDSFYTATLSLASAEAAKLYSFSATVGDQGYSIVELVNDGVTDWDTQADSALGVDLEIVDGVYQIYTAAGLKMFADAVNGGSYSLSAKLMDDIDLGGSEENQWTPIGTLTTNAYTGTFDGGGFEVSGLYINGSSDYQGLFGNANGAAIYNVGVSGSVTGYYYVGGVVGRCLSNSTVDNCYNTASVEGVYYVGGVVGKTSSSSSVTNCYNTAEVEGGNKYIGGVVGHSSSPVSGCYNMGSVKGGDYVGGVVGGVDSSTITNCYNTAEVVDAGIYSYPYIGGVVGFNPSTVTNCYYNSDNYSGDGVGYANSSATTTNIIGYSTSIMQSDYLVALLNRAAYSYNESIPSVDAYGWVAVEDGYPALDSESAPTNNSDLCTVFGSGTESDPYLIFEGVQLRDLSEKVNGGETYSGKYFEMTCDIDLGGIDDDGNGVAENEFTAIGTSQTYSFQGTFDGGGYEISGLYINQPDSNYQGLFGYIDGVQDNNAVVKNLGVSGSVTGSGYVGGIVGRSYWYVIISNCYNAATVVAKDDYVGGIVGCLNTGGESTVSNCYNAGKVVGEGIYVGGIAGRITNAIITDCYNTAVVEGAGRVGGIVGSNNSYGRVYNSYNTATIKLTASDDYVGGVVGYNCYGRTINTVSSCYSTGGIEMAEGVTTDYAGGIVGYNRTSYSDGSPCVVENCIYDSSVYDGDAIGANEGTSTNNSGSTTLKATMTGGSFSSTLGSEWKEDYSTQINEGYPILSWQ